MYSSEAILRNNMSSSMSSENSMLFASITTSNKHGLDGDFLKSKDMMMSSDVFQQQQSNGGLTRYRSAPSTFFSSFIDGINANNGATSDSSHGDDETETMFSAFMNCGNRSSSNEGVERDLGEANHQEMLFSPSLKQERVEFDQQNKGFSSSNSQLVYGNSMNGGDDGNGSYDVVMDNQMQGRLNGTGNCSNSNLLRQSSSPAGFFNGFDVMREVGSFKASNVTHGESNSTNNGLKNHMNFSPRLSPTSMFMPCIPENVSENIATQNPQSEHKRQVNEANGKYVSGFANVSFNDSRSGSLKRNREDDIKMFSGINGLENQNEESRNISSGLIHHLSLPKTSSEMAAVEKYLHFQQDVVPCKIRAKRGFATHPRSIAERMRRTRISERMKKLQELFPNMDKQTNTADMLDLAVEYIKDLQKQVQTLTDVKAKCRCSSDHPTS